MGATDLLEKSAFVPAVDYLEKESSDESSLWTSIELHGLGQVNAVTDREYYSFT